jgi:Flp pilus assembly pilin Flp
MIDSRFLNRRRRGMGLTEYIILAALVAIGTLGLVSIFGDGLRSVYSVSANNLAGESSRAQFEGATSLTQRNLGNFALGEGHRESRTDQPPIQDLSSTAVEEQADPGGGGKVKR